MQQTGATQDLAVRDVTSSDADVSRDVTCDKKQHPGHEAPAIARVSDFPRAVSGQRAGNCRSGKESRRRF